MFEGTLGAIFRYVLSVVLVLGAIWWIVLDRASWEDIIGKKKPEKQISKKRSNKKTNKTKKRNKKNKKQGKQ